jgi:hypothetical protein
VGVLKSVGRMVWGWLELVIGAAGSMSLFWCAGGPLSVAKQGSTDISLSWLLVGGTAPTGASL